MLGLVLWSMNMPRNVYFLTEHNFNMYSVNANIRSDIFIYKGTTVVF